ncbi:MAG: GtrA family protein [Marinilabiliaceae bacterium]|nr:GtrA family protein [Marinilabiliaceae bacterium]
MKLIATIQRLIIIIIDWFYRPFRKFIPEQTFKYAFCGGSNTSFDIVLYFVFYNFIVRKREIDFGLITLKPHISAFFLTFPITFITGFLLSKYITFTESELRGRIQLFRYGLTVIGSIILNYIFLKLFVEYFNIYPTPSKILTTGIVVIFSYFSQKYFSFKIDTKP